MNFLKSCGWCVLPTYNSGVCPVMRRPPTAEDPPCASFTRTIEICARCGVSMLPKAAILTPKAEGYVVFCDNCASMLGSCNTCGKHNTCTNVAQGFCQEWQLEGGN